MMIDDYLNISLPNRSSELANLQQQIIKTLTKNSQLIKSAKMELSQGIGEISESQQMEDYQVLPNLYCRKFLKLPLCLAML